MLIRNTVKPVLLTLSVCIAVGSAVGFDRLLGATGPNPMSGPSGNDNIGDMQMKDIELKGVKCVLLVSQCPSENPNCGKEPVRVEVSCADASCLAAPQSCTPLNAPGASSARSNASTARSNSSSARSNLSNDLNNSCMLRRFECAKGSFLSCYKRWRTTSLNCTDNLCGTANCLRSDMFFSTYKLEAWDTGSLPGPFPRTETMCIVQSSPCDPKDPSCLSPVSLEQLSCDDAKCIAGNCTRMSILVDQSDTIVSGNTETSGTSDSQQNDGDGSGKEGSNGEENKGTRDDGTTVNGGSNENHGETVAAGTTKALGCFDDTGTWTTDRTRCATNQKKYVEPTVTDSTEQSGNTETTEDQKVVERSIESQFVPDTRKSALVQNILSSTVDAISRLTRILDNQMLPADVRTSLEQRLDSLRAVQDIVSTSDQSVRDLQILADSVANDLNGIQETVKKWMESSPRTFPVTVTDKLDRLFTTLPSIFGILLQEGISVESTTMDAYLAAQQTYDSVHATCVTNSDTCGNLSKVLDALEPVYASIRLSLEKAGRTDLEQKIDAVLQ